MNPETSDPRPPGLHRGDEIDERPPGGTSRDVTGVGGSDSERRTAERLAAELRSTGREVQVQEVRVRLGQGITVVAHATPAVAGSLLGLLSPILGAAIVLLTAFSFYAERALGLLLLGRILPRRRVRNVLSPPPGPVWEQEVDVILAAGYDAPPAYPAGAWLARRFGGRLTTDRLVFWAGMVPLFAALMLRLAGLDGLGTQLLQVASTSILLAAIAAQADGRLKGRPVGVEEDLTAARDLITVVRELADDAEDDRDGAGVAVCLFGAESDGAAGAEAFYSDRRLKVKPGVTVIGMVAASPGAGPQATGREGDLSSTAMDFDLVEQSPLRPERVAIRRDTAAGRARRRGARAVTVVGRGEDGLDLVFDVLEAAERKETNE